MPSLSEWIQRFKKVHGNTYDYQRVEQPRGHRLITIICKIHGEFKQSPYNHLKGHGCNLCASIGRGKASRKSQDDFIAQARAFHGDKFTYEKVEYVTSRTPVVVTCRIHGDFTVSPHNLIRKKSCPGCASDNRGKYEGQQEISQRTAKARIELARSQIIQKAREVHGDTYEYDLDSYTSARNPMIIICGEHGPFRMRIGHHIKRGHICPVCAKSVSSHEYAIMKYLDSLGVSYKPRDRNVLGTREIDILIPQKKLGIELNGRYWHTDDREHKWGLRKKWEEAQSKGIRLIHIFDDEWDNKKMIIQDLIKASLGLRKTLQARKLTVSELTLEESRDFLETWHIQGYLGCQVRLGLKLGNQLVSVLTLGKSRFSQDPWEVIRYASSHHIPGGFDKLFSYFVKKWNPTSVITFSDLRLGSGKSYLSSGFIPIEITTPDYWWIKGRSERIPRYQTQKHKLQYDHRFGKFYAPELTEVQICEAAGYKKVSGVGNLKLKWIPQARNRGIIIAVTSDQGESNGNVFPRCC